MIKAIVKGLRLCIFRAKFRKENTHNSIQAMSYFPIDKVSVGKNSYGPLDVIWMTNREAKVIIGNYVSIGPRVKFLVGGEHDYNRISTWPFQTKVYEEMTQSGINRDITIQDDVWIGYDSLILSGVTIGKGSVIGARSIVAKNIPPYSIFVGNKIIKKRFSDVIIDKLMSIDFSTINHKKNDCYQRYCQTKIDENNIDVIIENFVGGGE